MPRTMRIALAFVIACAVHPIATTSGAVIDLTVDGSSYVGTDGSRFLQGQDAAAGTVLQDPFLRLQAGTGVTTEQGFNTDFRPLPPDAVGTTTVHSITLGSLAPRVVTTSQGSYVSYSFILDVNESSTLGNNYLSLDELRLYTASAPNIATSTDLATTAVLRYDVDATSDQAFLLDALNEPGTGTPDLQFDIPTSYFSEATAGEFVYVFMRFGVQGSVAGRNYGTSDGFEELRAVKLAATGVELEEAIQSGQPWCRVLGMPSSSGARLRYYIPRPGRVRITMHDVRGRAVAAYEAPETSSGLRELPLADLRGFSRLSSGVYYYALRWNGLKRTGRITLVR